MQPPCATADCLVRMTAESSRAAMRERRAATVFMEAEYTLKQWYATKCNKKHYVKLVYRI